LSQTCWGIGVICDSSFPVKKFAPYEPLSFMTISYGLTILIDVTLSGNCLGV